jgi:hypothetical protein
MTDYQPLLARALKGLDRNTSEARRAVYDRARQALLNQLRSASPPMADADITRERLALEDAIRKTETEAVLAEPHSVRASVAPRMPSAPRPSAAPALTAAVSAAPQARAPVPAAVPRISPTVTPVPRTATPAAAPAQPSPPPPVMRTTPAASPREPEAGAPEVPRAAPRPQMPPRMRPDAPGNGARPGREVHTEHAPRPRPRNNELPPRDSIEEFPSESDAPYPAPPRRLERPRPSRPDERARGAVPPDASLPPSPPARPRAARPGPAGGPMPAGKIKPAKNNRMKILIGAVAMLLIVGAGIVAFTMRGRMPGSSAPQTAAVGTDQPKSDERIAQAQDGQRPATPTNIDPSVAQKAALYEENPGGGQQFQNFNGTAIWKTEAVSGAGRAPELGLRIEIEIPERHINVVMKMRRNSDPSFPASHTIEIMFDTPGDAFGGVADMRGIRAKGGETAQGNPIIAEVQKVKEGYFLLAMPNLEEDNNLALLRERDWIDVPFVYANGRRAVLTFQKGTPGERAIREVFSSWGKTGG